MKIIKTDDFVITGTWTSLGSGLKYISEGFLDKTLTTNNDQFDS